LPRKMGRGGVGEEGEKNGGRGLGGRELGRLLGELKRQDKKRCHDEKSSHVTQPRKTAIFKRQKGKEA